MSLISSLNDPFGQQFFYGINLIFYLAQVKEFSMCPSFVLNIGLIFAQVINCTWVNPSVEGVSSACLPEEETNQVFILIYPECRRLESWSWKSSWSSVLETDLLVICVRKSREKSRKFSVILKGGTGSNQAFRVIKNCISRALTTTLKLKFVCRKERMTNLLLNKWESLISFFIRKKHQEKR